MPAGLPLRRSSEDLMKWDGVDQNLTSLLVLYLDAVGAGADLWWNGGPGSLQEPKMEVFGVWW